MAGRRRGAEGALEQALRALGRALDASGATWMVIGGVAIIAHGVRRMTTDIDACIRGDEISVDRLVEVLGSHGIEPRIPKATEFARANLVLLARHVETGVDLDLSLGWTAFEHEALAARTSARFGAVRVPMASVEALLVFKAIAARGRDREDIASLLALYPDLDLRRVRERIAELAAMADEPAMMVGLELLSPPPRGHRSKAPAPGPTKRPRTRTR